MNNFEVIKRMIALFLVVMNDTGGFGIKEVWYLFSVG